METIAHTPSDEMVQQLKDIPSFRGIAGFLSNFSPYKADEYHHSQGVNYPSVEHFYQASKFDDLKTRYMISVHPFKGLKAFVRTLPGYKYDFDVVKDGIMLIGLLHKFTLPRYKELLLTTGNEELIERNTWNDTYWGVSYGTGQNKLGIMLMDIRRRTQTI